MKTEEKVMVAIMVALVLVPICFIVAYANLWYVVDYLLPYLERPRIPFDIGM